MAVLCKLFTKSNALVFSASVKLTILLVNVYARLEMVNAINLGLGLTRFRGPIRVKRSSSMKGVGKDGQERQALLA